MRGRSAAHSRPWSGRCGGRGRWPAPPRRGSTTGPAGPPQEPVARHATLSQSDRRKKKHSETPCITKMLPNPIQFLFQNTTKTLACVPRGSHSSSPSETRRLAAVRLMPTPAALRLQSRTGHWPPRLFTALARCSGELLPSRRAKGSPAPSSRCCTSSRGVSSSKTSPQSPLTPSFPRAFDQTQCRSLFHAWSSRIFWPWTLYETRRQWKRKVATGVSTPEGIQRYEKSQQHEKF